ncbi:TTN [Mytilus edulis]|uniref:TTN n=1 Tax=Mytilus edulis TaxID=6550 RepID=A0A8S3Q8G2_MYTED|nr:TTN [Mytilus edulis]
MDSKLKSVRAGHKGAVTKLLVKFDELKSKTDTEVDEVKALDDAVTQKQKTLIDLNNRLLEQTSEENLEQEITDSDEYMYELDCKIRQIRKFIKSFETNTIISHDTVGPSTSRLNPDAYHFTPEARVDMNRCAIDSMNQQYSINAPALHTRPSENVMFQVPSDMMSFVIKQKGRPDFPTNRPYVERNGQLIHLKWEMARKRNENSIWYTIEMNRMEESAQWNAILTDITLSSVTMEDEHSTEDVSFRVFAENEVGKTSPTLPAILKRREKRKNDLQADENETNKYFTQIQSNELVQKNISLLNNKSKTIHGISSVTGEKNTKYGSTLPKGATLAAPETLEVFMEYNTVILRWKSSTSTERLILNPETYSIENSSDDGKSWSLLTDGLEGLEQKLDSFPVGKYQFRVKAHNRFGSSQVTNPVKTTPTAPKSLEVLIENYNIILRWKSATLLERQKYNLETYSIEISSDDGKSWSLLVDGLKGLEQKWNKWSVGISYQFRVKAHNRFGSSEGTNPVKFVREPPPNAPQTLEVLMENNTVILRWKSSTSKERLISNPETYSIEMSSDDGKSWSLVSNEIEGLEEEWNAFPVGKHYQFRVTAHNKFGSSKVTNPVKFVRELPPNAPQTLEVLMENNTVILRWKSSTPKERLISNPETYSIEMSSDDGISWSLLTDGLERLEEKWDATPIGECYQFRVKAHNRFGSSEVTNPVKFVRHVREPPPSAPHTLEVLMENKIFILRWKSFTPKERLISNPETYSIEKSRDDGKSWSLLTDGLEQLEKKWMHSQSENITKPPPSSPQTLEVLMENNTVILRWKSSTSKERLISNPETYSIDMSSDDGISWSLLTDGLEGLEQKWDAIPIGARYQFRVKAHNKFGSSKVTNPVKFVREPPPNAPQTLEVLMKNYTVILRWKSSTPKERLISNPETYSIEMSSDDGKSWSLPSDNIKGFEHALVAFPVGKHYQFRVTAHNKFGASKVTNPVKFVREPPPSAPQTLEVLMKNNVIILRWKSSTPKERLISNPETYSIEKSSDDGKSWLLLTDGLKRLEQKWSIFPVGKHYQFRVKAHNKFGSSEVTNPVKFVREPPPNAPQTLEVLMENNTVILCWKSSTSKERLISNPETYSIEMSIDDGKSWSLLADGLERLEHKWDAFPVGKHYQFRVKAHNKFGASKVTNPVKFVREPPPSAPQTLEVLMENNTVILCWKSSTSRERLISNPETYSIEMSSDDGKSWSLLADGLERLEHKWDATPIGECYHFRVKAHNKFGSSEVTNPVKFVREPPPSAPQTLEVLMENNTVILCWKSSTSKERLISNPETYSIEMSIDDGKSWSLLADGLERLEHKWDAFPVGKHYQFRVKAHNKFGSSKVTNPVKFVREPPPNAPQTLEVLMENNTVILRWKSSTSKERLISNPETYSIEMSSDDGKSWSLLSDGLERLEQKWDATPIGECYHFRVKAHNKFGSSKVTNPVKFVREPPPNAPQTLEVLMENNTVILCWKSSTSRERLISNPETYSIEMSIDDGKSWSLLADGLERLEQKWDAIPIVARYQFRVKAHNKFGSSKVTNPVKFVRESPPNAPQTLEVLMESNTVILRWKSSTSKEKLISNPETYSIEMSSDDGKSWSLLSDGLERLEQKWDATPIGECYHFRVKAHNKFGSSKVTNPVKFVRGNINIFGTASNAPQTLEVLMENNTVILCWKSSTSKERLISNPETYSIEMSIDDGKSWSLLTDGLERLEHKWDAFPVGKHYQFRVKAHNKFGSSEVTNPVKFVRVTSIFLEVIINNNIVTFRWKSTTNPQKSKSDPLTYSIELSVDNGKSWFRYMDGLTSLDFSSDNLEYGIPYKIRVKAHSPFGASKATDVEEFVKGFWITKSSLRDKIHGILKRKTFCYGSKSEANNWYDSANGEPKIKTSE